MNNINILSETSEVVTLRRVDFETLVELATDAEDLTAVWAERAAEAIAGGYAKAKSLYYTADEVRQILDGVSAIRIWRNRRGMTGKALAEATGLQASYISEIESGKKPGSVSAHLALSKALAVPMEFLAE